MSQLNERAANERAAISREGVAVVMCRCRCRSRCRGRAAILWLIQHLALLVEHHGVFQQFHYGEVTGDDPNARDIYRDHPSFHACAEFCALYDQNCFDPNFESDPIESIVPVVERVF
jgi:hypothetical protein